MVQLAPRFAAILAFCFLVSATPVVHRGVGALDPHVSISVEPISVGSPSVDLDRMVDTSDAHGNHTARAVAVTNNHPVSVVEQYPSQSHEQARRQGPITSGVQNTPSMQHDVVLEKNVQAQPSQSQDKPSHSGAATASPTQGKTKRYDEAYDDAAYDDGQYRLGSDAIIPNAVPALPVPVPVLPALPVSVPVLPTLPVPALPTLPVPAPLPVTATGAATMSSSAPGTTASSASATDTTSTAATSATETITSTSTTAVAPTETAIRAVAATAGGKRSDDGQYHSDAIFDDGQYHPNAVFDDGKYHISPAGGKRSDNGQYHPDSKFNDDQHHSGKHNSRRGLVHQGKVRAARRRALH